MNKTMDIAVVGRDPRLAYCAERLLSRGVRSVRFEESRIPDGFGCYLFAPPLKAARLSYTGFAEKGVTVFAGAADDESKRLITARGAVLIDYCECEYFASENAELTAEAAMTVYTGASAASFKHAKALVAGFGRIGKALAFRMRAFGADVTVSARKIKDIELICAYGCKPIETAAIRGEYDVIFNTIPAPVFTRDITDRTKTDYYIELASEPFGIDGKAAWSGCKKVIRASGLPGKVLPVSAGRLIADAVCTLLKESRI